MNPLRPLILAAADSPRMKRALTGIPVTADIVRRFVVGETRDDLIEVAQALLNSGRMVSVDFLGESDPPISRSSCARWSANPESSYTSGFPSRSRLRRSNR